MHFVHTAVPRPVGLKLDVASSRTVVAASPEVPEAEYPGINGRGSNRACMVRQDEDMVSQTTRATKTLELGPSMFIVCCNSYAEEGAQEELPETRGRRTGKRSFELAQGAACVGQGVIQEVGSSHAPFKCPERPGRGAVE